MIRSLSFKVYCEESIRILSMRIRIINNSGTPLQYSCLENLMDGEAWWAAVHGVDKSRTRLSDFTFTFHFPALEKEMATHSSVLAWRIPGTGEPGRLPSVGSHRVGHDWSDLAAAYLYLGEGNGTPLQYSCLENPMDGGAWLATVHGVARSRTRLSDFTFTFHFHALEKEMATHFSVLAWRIPGTTESGGLLSLGSHRVRHDWSDLVAAALLDQHFV